MAEIIDKGDRIKVVRDNGKVTIYDKLGTDGNLQLEAQSVNNEFVILQSGVKKEAFSSFKEITNPKTESFNELVDAVDDIIRDVFNQENKVLVKSQADLENSGTVVGDDIFLNKDTIYQFTDTVELSKNIVIADNDLLRGENRIIDGVKFTNGFGFRSASTAIRFSIEKMMMSSPTGELMVFDTTDGRVDVRECNIDTNKEIGTITNLAIFNLRDCFIINTTSRGFVFNGTNNGIINIKDCISDATNSGVAYDFTGDWNIIDVDKLIAFIGGGSTLLKVTPTLTLTKGRVTNCDIIDLGGVITSGFDSTSIDWVFTINLGLKGSRVVGEIFFNDNAVETELTTINTPVKIAGSFTDGILERFENSGNALKYIGKESITIKAKAKTILDLVSGNNLTIAVYVTLNGVIVGKSVGKDTLTSSNDDSIIIADAFIDVVTNDVIEAFVENQSGSQDILATDILLEAASR